MSRALIILLSSLLFIGCGDRKNNSEKQKKADEVSINFDTETGIPEFSAITEDPTELVYNFVTNDSAHLKMDYNLNMEFMGQKMPITMQMESKYFVTNVTDKLGHLTLQFTRIAMQMNGPQVINYDSDTDSDPMGSMLGRSLSPLLNNPVSAVISPKGKIIETSINSLLQGFDTVEASQIREQISSAADQFIQNTFIPFPKNAVAPGSTYSAGTETSSAANLEFTKDIHYKVKSISKNKRYIVIEPSGILELNAEKEGIKTVPGSNIIHGWVLFDMQRSFIIQSDLHMEMTVMTKQMGQDMKIKLSIDIKMKMK
ncbi:MAG: DUF6263 family protein [Salinivirgaceae bacterium]|jgi:hypothetical protein|nr:DUF6263 family protein [Salinivirgaceae bacterium]